jgi:hypothetical protein
MPKQEEFRTYEIGDMDWEWDEIEERPVCLHTITLNGRCLRCGNLRTEESND